MMAAIADWNPEREALFYVIDREVGGVVAKYKVRAPSKRHVDDELIFIHSEIRPILISVSIPSMLTMKEMTSS